MTQAWHTTAPANSTFPELHAQTAPPLHYENAVISFFPDFTQLLQRQPQTFIAVKKKLRERGLKYAMMFLARLRVEVEGRSWLFDNPAVASDWLDSRIDSGPGGRSGLAIWSRKTEDENC